MGPSSVGLQTILARNNEEALAAEPFGGRGRLLRLVIKGRRARRLMF